MDDSDTARRDFPGVEFVELAGPVKVFPNVHIGEGSVVYGPCILGHPPRGKAPGDLPLVIGRGATIRAFTVLYAGVSIGDLFQSGHNTVIREGNVLGDDCSVGSGAILEPGNHACNRVRIHTNAAMEGATMADDAYIGPGALLLDDPHAPCPRSKECVGGAKIGVGALVGAGAIVLAGVTVGERAVVAAGTMATKDVAPGVVVVGNPARPLKRIDEIECFAGFYPHAYAWPVHEIRSYAQDRRSIVDK